MTVLDAGHEASRKPRAVARAGVRGGIPPITRLGDEINFMIEASAP